jgi:hypothetical protein
MSDASELYFRFYNNFSFSFLIFINNQTELKGVVVCLYV